jgi:hypothetical protein
MTLRILGTPYPIQDRNKEDVPYFRNSITAAAFEEPDEVVDGEVVRDGNVMLLGELDDRTVQGVDFGSFAGGDVLERGGLVCGCVGD